MVTKVLLNLQLFKNLKVFTEEKVLILKSGHRLLLVLDVLTYFILAWYVFCPAYDHCYLERKPSDVGMEIASLWSSVLEEGKAPLLLAVLCEGEAHQVYFLARRKPSQRECVHYTECVLGFPPLV